MKMVEYIGQTNTSKPVRSYNHRREGVSLFLVGFIIWLNLDATVSEGDYEA